MNFFIYKATGLIGTPSVTGYIEPSQAAEKIAGFFTLFLTFCVIAATFFFIRGGLDYIMSGGDPGKVKSGMAAIQYSIIGLVVASAGFLVIEIVKNALGIGSIDLNL